MNAYIGNGAYCYANSAAMMLAAKGETIEPGLLEVASGFSLGAHLIPSGLLFFDNCSETPDSGITRAMELLGFRVQHRVQEEGTALPLYELGEALDQGPVMLGPLDMGKLVYNPNHNNLGGCDHYVLALEIREHEVWLHDPAGFPYVCLTLEQLNEAWKGGVFPWSPGAYRFWSGPERVEQLDVKELHQRVLSWFRETMQNQYQTKAAESGRTGKQAILHKANQIRDGAIDMDEWSHYVYFALPVGARRAHDYGSFFKNNHGQLSGLKYKQSRQFGECQSRLAARHWQAAADAMEALAETEAAIEEALLQL
ncbi:hypothetical protein [Paenibacillus sp. JJ-223]|uniref:hypothetical protein n=1 Tax=Paenibacillus sp. JJ-223 TaxID=2905647 RepID=UPI001F22350B|nr:hypothetical protein [Paenibacillus sp. JJ-223]CAH1196723.1 hypothetical protein PAECIP111890_01004 [Paenibacillus sp. JJ-223]